jgi:hypothetical protein
MIIIVKNYGEKGERWDRGLGKYGLNNSAVNKKIFYNQYFIIF